MLHNMTNKYPPYQGIISYYVIKNLPVSQLAKLSLYQQNLNPT